VFIARAAAAKAEQREQPAEATLSQAAKLRDSSASKAAIHTSLETLVLIFSGCQRQQIYKVNYKQTFPSA